jgi:thymidylate synthase ThyX
LNRNQQAKSNEELTPLWLKSCLDSERNYFVLREAGLKPEDARGALNLDLQTLLVIKTNFTEWIHIFKQRVLGTTGRPHPQVRALLGGVLVSFARKLPMLFGPLLEECKERKIDTETFVKESTNEKDFDKEFIDLL